MSNTRSLLWLVIGLAATGVAHFLVSYNDAGVTSAQRRMRLVSFPVAGTKSVEVTGEGRSPLVIDVEAEKLVKPVAAEVDIGEVKRTLDALSAEVRDVIGAGEMLRLGRSRGDFGLDPSRLRVKVIGGGFEHVVDFGCLTPDGNGVYVAVAGDTAVSIVPVSTLSAVSRDVGDYRQRLVFPRGTESVKTIAIRRSTGERFRLAKNGKGWIRIGDEAESSSTNANTLASIECVTELLKAAQECRAIDFVNETAKNDEPGVVKLSALAGYGLDPESTSTTLALRYDDGGETTVSFGKPAGEGKVYALSGAAVVSVSAAVASLAEKIDPTDSRLYPLVGNEVKRLSVRIDDTECLLAKDEVTAQWHLDAPISAPCDGETVDALVKRIISLTAADRVQEDSSDVISVSVNGAPALAVSRVAVMGEKRLEDLRSKKLLKLEAAEVKRIGRIRRLENGVASSIFLGYDRESRTWSVENSDASGEVDVSAVEAVVATLGALEADRIVRLKVSPSELRNYGLEEPNCTIAVDLAKSDSVRRNLLLGDAAADGSVYATLGSADAIFTLSKETLRLLTAPLTDERSN